MIGLMRLGVRGRLFFASIALIAVVGIPSALYLESELREWLVRRVRTELLHHARVAAEAVKADRWDLDALADRLGASTESRITFIGPDGSVLGDSEVPESELGALDDHGTRPEVIEALEDGVGRSTRHSTTLDADMLYVAIPAPIEGRPGIIRAAVPLEEVDAVIASLRWMMAAAGAVGILVALLMTFWAAELVSKPVRQLVDRSRPLVHADTPTDEPFPSSDDDLVPGSVASMARELDRTLATLAKERDRFETVLESMREAVLALNSSSQLRLVNPAATELLDLGPDALNRPLEELVEASELREIARRGQEGPASVEMSYGDRRLMVRATPLSTSGGTVIVIHDVTEMRRLETIRKDFVANVSHELRTPVSIIRANTETLLDGGLDDPKRSVSFVEAIHRHSERLSNLLADLLDLSRIEAGRYKLNFRNLDCVQVAARGAEAVEARAKDRGIRIRTECAKGLEVRADPKATDQILMNLLDNAIKYSAEDSEVEVKVFEAGDHVRFEVADNGRGIAADQRERIFERFYRVDPGRSRDMGGTGLGLAIVKHLAESMGGHVGVDAGEPSGSVFWFTLPRLRQPSFHPVDASLARTG